ncbi:Gag-Pol polyprotein [Vitis vinifera]|uniref:Gag-Pol polyprotein n=1 Tax=Vitis vinifera TaxID=29760 RepID=A0A438HMB0_VITVI|nr:Gag-Pol polyprotein [Vitis vinifera]
MTKIFKPLVGRTVEVHIDDIVVKSKTRGEHALHLQEVFHLLRKYGMKLNPSKCAFGGSARKFLGFMVSQRGIEVSPDQVKAVMETPPPKSKKELQRLIGKLVALGRFIARFTDELRPFFLAIRKAEWAISVVLFRCPSHKEKKPIYYVSRALVDVKTRYSKMEQTTLALRSPTQKLRPYIQAHPVVAIELSEYGIEYQPRLSMKGQVMADFVLEYSQKPTQHKEPREEEWWTLRVDGASRSSGSGVGLLLQSPLGEQLEQVIRLGFPASNNKAEYEAILSGLDLALTLSVSKLRVYSDSQLVVRHVQEEYEAKDERMARYLTKVRDTLQRSLHLQYYWGEPSRRPRMDGSHNKVSPDRHFARRTQDPLPAAAAQKKFLLVATDYFSKWVEAKAYASIKDKDVTKFVWKNIICRFGIPQTIIADNGPQFDSITFQNFCSELNIRNLYSTPRYPQSNGQAETTNKTLVTALKKRLEQAKGKWVEELPGVLWAYRTTPGRPIGNTPFTLTYGMDAVIPTEIGLPTIRTEAGRQG